VPYSSCEQHWQTLPAKPGSFAFRSRISAPAFSALPTTIHSWRSQIVDRHDFSRYTINCRRLSVSIKPSISTAVRLYGWSTFSNRIVDVPLDTLNSEPVLPAGCTKHLGVSDKIGAAAAGADIVGMWFSGWLAGWRERGGTCQIDVAPSIDHDTHYPHRISCVQCLHSFIHSFPSSIHPSISTGDVTDGRGNSRHVLSLICAIDLIVHHFSISLICILV